MKKREIENGSKDQNKEKEDPPLVSIRIWKVSDRNVSNDQKDEKTI
jgi:hypothetical protein